MFPVSESVKAKKGSTSVRLQERLNNLLAVYYERLSRGLDTTEVERKIKELQR